MKFKKRIKQVSVVSLAVFLGLIPNGIKNVQNVYAQSETKKVTTEKKNLEGIITSKIIIDNEIYYAGPNYVLDEEENPVDPNDIDLISKAIETRNILEKIAKEAKAEYGIQPALLEVHAELQRKTMEYSEELEDILTLPVKILANLTTGTKIAVITPDEIEDKEQISKSFEDIAKNPEKHFRQLALAYFSRAKEGHDKNRRIVEKIKGGALLDYETAKRYWENSMDADLYFKTAQKLYHNIEKAKPLKERWIEEFTGSIDAILSEIKGIGVDKETLEKIFKHADGKLTEYGPYQTFKADIRSKAEELNKREKEREEKITKIISRLTGSKIISLESKVEDSKDKTESLEDSVDELVRKYVQQAVKYIGEEKFAAAATLYEKVIELEDEKKWEAMHRQMLLGIYEKLGNKYEDKGSYDKAIDTYEKMTKVYPPLAFRGHILLGLIYATRANSYLEQRNFGKAREIYRIGRKEMIQGLEGYSKSDQDHGIESTKNYYKVLIDYDTQLSAICGRDGKYDQGLRYLEHGVPFARKYNIKKDSIYELLLIYIDNIKYEQPPNKNNLIERIGRLSIELSALR